MSFKVGGSSNYFYDSNDQMSHVYDKEWDTTPPKGELTNFAGRNTQFKLHITCMLWTTCNDPS